jgi:hypothetical protein
MSTILSAECVSLAEIWIYPIKSLPGVKLQQAALRENGALADDRRWAIFDLQGQMVNGKRTARVHALDMRFRPTDEQVTLIDRPGGREATFCLASERAAAADWLGEFFGFQVELREDAERGFPDDLEAWGPTVVSTATLSAVAGWFPPLKVEEVRRRFRANLELNCPVPFWEDCLFGPAGQIVRFFVGQIELAGVNPCQRCVVPTRDSQSAEVYPRFAAEFSERRASTLAAWAPSSRFDHFYRLAVNTRGVGRQGHRLLRVGDPIGVLGAFPE